MHRTGSKSEYVLNIPYVPVSENSKTWRTWYLRYRYNLEIKDAVYWLCREQAIPPLESIHLTAIVYFATRRRRDQDDFTSPLYKPINDGLVMAGIIPDDDQDHISIIPPILSVGQSPRIELTIYERT